MDIDIRKTATDAAYIAVGAGVLGFQQAQVRRQDAKQKIQARANDARAFVTSSAQSARQETCQLVSRADSVRSQVRDRASAVATVDPRQWVEPIVEAVTVRVEPVIEHVKVLPEQLQTVPDQLQGIPEQFAQQFARVVELGRSRVAEFRGNDTVVASA